MPHVRDHAPTPRPRRPGLRILNPTTIGAGIGLLVGVALTLLVFVLPAARGTDGETAGDALGRALLGAACVSAVLTALGAAGGWVADAAVRAAREAKLTLGSEGEFGAGEEAERARDHEAKRPRRRARPRTD